jgi:outer membrane lipoprotein carrier protein
MTSRYVKQTLCANALGLSLLFIPGASFAQPETLASSSHAVKANDANEMKHAKIKTQLINKLQTLKFFSANFQQNILDGTGTLLQQAEGTLAINKPNLVNWHTTEPDETLIVSNGKSLWFYDPFIEQVTIYSVEKSMVNTPILLLSSVDKKLWDNYQVTSTNDENYVIHALDDNSQVKSLSLTFSANTAKTELLSFSILDATGQLSVMTLSKVDYDKQPSPALFEFIVPEGVSINAQQ